VKFGERNFETKHSQIKKKKTRSRRAASLQAAGAAWLDTSGGPRISK